MEDFNFNIPWMNSDGVPHEPNAETRQMKTGIEYTARNFGWMREAFMNAGFTREESIAFIAMLLQAGRAGASEED